MKTVRDAMTENPRSIETSASVVAAAQLLRDEAIGSVPVVEDGRLVGMLTDATSLFASSPPAPTLAP